MLGGVEDATEKDMLPPEGEKDSRVMFIDLACCLGRIVGGGEARSDVSDRRAVGG